MLLLFVKMNVIQLHYCSHLYRILMWLCIYWQMVSIIIAVDNVFVLLPMRSTAWNSWNKIYDNFWHIISPKLWTYSWIIETTIVCSTYISALHIQNRPNEVSDMFYMGVVNIFITFHIAYGADCYINSWDCLKQAARRST
jgi:hypothetical protein